MTAVTTRKAPATFRVSPRDSGLASDYAHVWRVSDRAAQRERVQTAAASKEPSFREVLVPLDGSSYAEHALPWAIQIATLAGAQLRVMHIHARMQPGFHGRRAQLYTDFDRLLREPMEEYSADLTRRIARASSVAVKPSLLDGRDVANTLSDVVGSVSNLVVLATRGRTAVGRMLWGGASDGVLQGASGPVLHVRGYKCPADLTARPSLRRALAAVDESSQSASVLGAVSRLAKLADGQGTLLRVIPSPGLFTCGDGCAGNVFGGATKLDERPLEQLDRLAESWPADLPRPRTSLVWSDTTPAREILTQAREQEADYIAIATRNRGRMQRLMRPGVYDYLIRNSPIPVLVVKRPPDGSR
jgi:nucleotide-binding universal stress UspA family protein